MPLFPLLDIIGVEDFEWPNSTALLYLSINAFIGTFISDYCWARSVVLMGPLLTTLALSLTIPLSMIVSKLFNEKVDFTWMYFLGSFLIFFAFIAISFYDYRQKKLEKAREKENNTLEDANELSKK
jgi:solute carrier family 35 protein F5